MPSIAEEIEIEAENFWARHFCGCGEPDLAIAAFREIMDLFVEPDGERIAVHLDRARRDEYARRHGAGLACLILYWLDAMKLTEHGGSVHGSWLTTVGERVREQVLTGRLPSCMIVDEDG